ncbi:MULTISPECIES: hypothetical protein [Sphingobium]|uniref:hypothetical protein n=1 Tax=Sphingobium TaxID=165695 RepID=UPI00159C62E1|nr:hypothetical protein [Sphingobium sp. 15-1]
MQLVHVLSASIVLQLNDQLNIDRIWRVPHHHRPDPCVIRVFDLYSTPNGKPCFMDGGFQTDGLGCMRLAYWVGQERPSASDQAARNRFRALFADNPDEALKATLRIYLGTDVLAPGECGYFSAQQWFHHPTEMQAIAMIGQIARNTPPAP